MSATAAARAGLRAAGPARPRPRGASASTRAAVRTTPPRSRGQLAPGRRPAAARTRPRPRPGRPRPAMTWSAAAAAQSSSRSAALAVRVPADGQLGADRQRGGHRRARRTSTCEQDQPPGAQRHGRVRLRPRCRTAGCPRGRPRRPAPDRRGPARPRTPAAACPRSQVRSPVRVIPAAAWVSVARSRGRQLPPQRGQVLARGEHLLAVGDPEGDPQVRGQPGQVPRRRAARPRPARRPSSALERAQQVTAGRVQRGQHRAGGVRGGHERACAAPWAATGSARSPAPRAGPGTCQPNSAAFTWLSWASGMSTVTPSSGSPGRELVRQRQARPSWPGSRPGRTSLGGRADQVGGREGEQVRLGRAGPSSTSCRSAGPRSRWPGSARRRSRTGRRRRRRCRAAGPAAPARSASSSSPRFSWKNRWWVCQSPSTSACG